jgi:PAS domain S-box-containing protein
VDTDRVAAQESENSLLEAFMQLSPDAAVVVDRNGVIRTANSLAVKMFGYPLAELEGQPVELLIPDRLRAGHQGHLRDYTSTPRTRPMGHPGLDLRGRRRDGSEFPVDISLAPLAGGGTDLLIVAAIRDVTELRERERLAARLAAIVQASDAAILSTLPDRTIDSWNPAAERIFGYRADEVLGRLLDELVPDDQRADLGVAYRRLAAGEQLTTADTWRLRNDGTPIAVAVSSSVIRDPGGRVIGYCEVLRDMTERLRQQHDLAAALADRELFADRDRIARHLHDSVIHRVFAAGIAVHSAETLVSEPAARQRLERAVEELDTAVKEIRTGIFTMQRARDDAADPGGAPA